LVRDQPEPEDRSSQTQVEIDVALAIMQYLGKNGAIRGGQILFNGREMTTMSDEELQQIRGSQIAMVFKSRWPYSIFL
jgi:ABC-type microcin C transport system duplicated ATPase subunit YejF